MRSLRHRLEMLVLRLLLVVIPRLPQRVLIGLGDVLGTLGYALARGRRRVALDNLDRAYGKSLEPSEARRITRHCFRHFARITLDSVALLRLPAERVLERVQVEGLEHLRRAHARGRGVLQFTGHFGHWELAGLVQGWLGLPLVLIARPLDNPYLERKLAELRGRSGNRVVHRRQALREILRAVHAGQGVALVVDQDARGGGIFVPFFDRPASTTPALALVALRTGAAVLPTFALPEPGGCYRLVYEPEIAVEPSGDFEHDAARLTAACTATIERWVRSHPEMWLWLHRRWKTAPPPADKLRPPGANP